MHAQEVAQELLALQEHASGEKLNYIPNARRSKSYPQEVTSPTANRKYPQEVHSSWLNQQDTDLEQC